MISNKSEAIKIKNIYVDFDNTLVNSTKRICDLYNEDFQYYPKYRKVNWWEIETYQFKELNCAAIEYLLEYFGQPRFFRDLEIMDNAYEILTRLINMGYTINIVSMGTTQNLKLKEKWIYENLPYKVKFIPIDFRCFNDKSHINMSDGILIDDEMRYLNSSNAKTKICFGDIYEWNKEWKGVRCANWNDIYRLFVNNKENIDMEA